MSHDDDWTYRVADHAGANKVGLNDVGLESYVSNIFSEKGDELRTQMKELGLTQQEANKYEEKLDKGTILLFNTNPGV